MKYVAAASALILTTTAIYATPSGLNNIPTADTTPQGTFVLQNQTTLSNNRDTDSLHGFKTGIDAGPVKLELGAASRITPGKGGPVTAHGKVAFGLGEGMPSIALGVVNGTASNEYRRRVGDEFFYAVISHDLGFLRVHGGCGSQDGEALPFFGVDKTFRTEATTTHSDGKTMKAVKTVETPVRDLFTLRADAIQQRSNDWLYSFGSLVPVCKNIVAEAWGNFPDNGDDASLTLKVNFVFKF
jgi:hypothetical protein